MTGPISELECRADNSCRKREYRRGEQQSKVAPQQTSVDPVDPGEHLVVVDPDDADVGERRQVGQVRGPLGDQIPRHHPAVARGLEIEHEQCDDDGEDTVAERLHTRALGEQAPV
jgi:hypothetical protein